MEILNAMPNYNFAGIEYQDYKKSKVIILPIPYDSTTSYNSGSRNGPHAIINASRNIEFYNEELDCDIQKEIGIYTLNELMSNINSPKENIDSIAKEVKFILDDSKIPFIIGGDHSVALGAIKALSESKEKFSILHFDAHSDTRDEFMGSRYGHASVMARARELCNNCYSVGVRSIDEGSMKKYRDEIFFMKEISKLSTHEIIKRINGNLKHDKVYITLDFDVLDPSEMPSTGTPEPDGLHYAQLKEIIRGVLKEKRLIGADFVELAPIPGLSAPDFLAAKLIYTTIGYAFCKKG